MNYKFIVAIGYIQHLAALNLPNYVARCAASVNSTTMLAIIKTESGGRPLALNINHKHLRLSYQPKNLNQAIAWANYLEQHGYNFDVGLAQINIKNIRRFGFHAHELFEPCLNLQLASRILLMNFRQAKSQAGTNPQQALRLALSAYNSGNFHSGFKNGYVSRVIKNASLIYADND